MIDPNQFQVNDAWIAFQLNDGPIHTEADGDFNCLALLDVASCFILSMSNVPITQTEPSNAEVQQMLKDSYSHKRQLPKTLYIPSDQPADNLTFEAELKKVNVVRVPEDQLLLCIGDARESFKEYFLGGGSRWN